MNEEKWEANATKNENSELTPWLTSHVVETKNLFFEFLYKMLALPYQLGNLFQIVDNSFCYKNCCNESVVMPKD